MSKSILIALVAGVLGGLIGAGLMFEYQNRKGTAQSDEVVFKLQVPKAIMDENRK